MLALIGLVVGALAGRVAWGEWGAVVGALMGFVAGALVATQQQRAAHRKPDALAQARAEQARAAETAVAPYTRGLELRLATLEARVRELEAALREGRLPREVDVPVPDEEARQRAATAALSTTRSLATPSAEAPAALASDVVMGADAAAPSPAAERAHAAAPAIAAADAALPPAAPPPAAARPSNPLWAWFTGGNAMTRIGVIVLFFGVAFLLRYFAEHFTIPVEAKLLAVAVVGVLLVIAGLRIARLRPTYGWSLQGAGTGVLYLTAFAAFREYAVVSAGAGFVLLAIVAALTIWLALQADAQPLAGLALAGAFLAPMLTGVEHDPLILFAYFALVNVVILVVAWSRPWRAVYLLGAAFTFALALVWGNAYYRPEHYAVVQPFLVLYFAIYVAIAVLQARLAAVNPAAPLDGLLVFGVPLVAFALQAALVSDREYGAAWSATGVALVYAALAFALRRRSEGALCLLGRVFTGLAVVFATIAIAFALDNRWTAALWSVEAALVFWLGMKQRTRAMRVLAMLLQVAAGVLFAVSGIAGDDDRLFANAFFMGSMLVSVAALVTVWLADRDPGCLDSGERAVLPLLFAWGALWWLGGGTFELIRQLARAREAHAVLAWVTGSAVVALLLSRKLGWSRLEALAWALPVTMAFVGMRDIERAQTTLTQFGWIVWPLAWVAYAYLLRMADVTTRRMQVAESEAAAAADASGASWSRQRATWLDGAHAAGAIALLAQLAWEASEWVGRVTAADTVWAACAAALPAMLYLGEIEASTQRIRWPFARHRDAYLVRAAAPIAVLLALWVLAVNVLSPGEPHPVPYVPLLNPLDVTLALAIWALFRWCAAQARITERQRYAALGVALFASLNGLVLRVGHHWGSIPWDLSELLDSRPLQATFTLAWTVTGAVLMYAASRRRIRALWMIGAALLAIVVVKLFALDLATLSGLPRVVAFLGVGSLLLLIGYVSPLPPSALRDPPAGANQPPA